MQLPMLEAAPRGSGCVFRGETVVDLGDLGEVTVIVSGCQRGRFERGLQSKLDELRPMQLDLKEMQIRLQSWIDGGSPCDMKYAEPEDRLSRDEAEAAERTFFGDSSGVVVRMRLGSDGMPIGLFLDDEGEPAYYEYMWRRRREIRRFRLLTIAAMFLFWAALFYLLWSAFH